MTIITVVEGEYKFTRCDQEKVITMSILLDNNWEHKEKVEFTYEEFETFKNIFTTFAHLTEIV